jgi:hypothetical protein
MNLQILFVLVPQCQPIDYQMNLQSGDENVVENLNEHGFVQGESTT